MAARDRCFVDRRSARSVADRALREQIEREPAAETRSRDCVERVAKFASVFFIASAKRTTPATIGRWR